MNIFYDCRASSWVLDYAD